MLRSPASGRNKPSGRPWHLFPCSLKHLRPFFDGLGCLFLHLVRCITPGGLKYLMGLRLHCSLNPGSRTETGLCDAHRFISNSVLNAFTNDRNDVKAEQRRMGKPPLRSDLMVVRAGTPRSVDENNRLVISLNGCSGAGTSPSWPGPSIRRVRSDKARGCQSQGI